MESTTPDELFDAISRDVHDNNVDLAKVVVEEVKQRLSVPIERVPLEEVYRRSQRGRQSEKTRASDALRLTHRDDKIHGDGYRVLRSIKGEPARLETGELRDSIQFDAIDLGDGNETVVFSDSPYGARLEGQPYDRLVLTDLLPTYEDAILDAAVRGIEGT